MDLLGFELTKEQIAELKQAEEEKKKRAEEMASRLEQKPDEEGENEDEQQDQPEGDQQGQEDKQRWQRKSLNALRRGKPASVPFESDNIPADERKRITLELLSAATPEQVKHIFGGDGYLDAALTPDTKSIMELTAALSAVALAMREQDGQPT